MAFNTLASRTALLLSLVIGVLFLGTSLVVFQQVRARSEASSIEALVAYNNEVVRQQEARFERIRFIQSRATEIFEQQLNAPPPRQPDSFDALFPVQPDGTRRSVPGLFDGTRLINGTPVHGIGAFIPGGDKVSPHRERELFAAFNTIRLLGEGIRPDLKSLYFYTPYNDLIMFAPDRPDRLMFYRSTAPADFNFQKEELAQIVSPRNNPRRDPRCTSLQPIMYDTARRIWTTGCMMPVDHRGEHVGAWGVSLMLDDIFERQIPTGLQRAKAIIVSHDGRLIYHPDFTRQADRGTERFLDLTKTDDPELKALWTFVKAHRDSGNFAGFVPGMHGFVSKQVVPTTQWQAITFFDKDTVFDLSRRAAQSILLIGLFGLLLESLIVGYLIWRYVGNPIAALTTRAEALGALAAAMPGNGPGFASDPGAPAPQPAERGGNEVQRLNASFDIMEKAVRTEHDRLAKSFELLARNVENYAICMLDPDGRIADWNRGAQSITGYGADEAIGQSVDMFYTPADRDAGVPDEQRQAARRDGQFAGSGWRLRKNGTEFWASVLMEPVSGSDARPLGIAMIMRDETEARQIELRLQDSIQRSRLAEDTAELGYWRIDLKDESLILSDWACRIHGFPLGSKLPLSAATGLYRPEQRAEFDAAVAEALKTGTMLDLQTTIDAADGVRRHIEVKGQFEHDLAGRRIALSGIVRDITDEVEASQRLVAARDAATAAAEARSELLATMSHEIRTPMTGIIGMLELIDGGPSAHDAAFDKIAQSARSLMVVLDDVLDHSKLESGHIALEHINFDLSKLLANSAALFAASAQAKGLEIICDVASPIHVMGDPTRIHQIVSNLLSNAIKFTANGSVTLAARQLAAGKWRITVRDTGIGFDPTAVPQLFSAYVQNDASTRRKFGGTGLGLSISRRLAEAMGGSMGADSEVGHGSLFWLELPLDPAEAPVVAANDDMLVLPAGAPPLRVLVADDAETTRIVAEQHLAALGCEVICVADGLSALARLAEGSTDVALLDRHMPMLEGSDTARLARLLPDGDAVTLVNFSASDSEGSGGDPAADLWNDRLAKPFTRRALIEMLNRAARRRQALPAAAPELIADEPLASLPPALRDRIIDSFGRDLPAQIAAFEAAVTDDDTDAARGALHALQGMSGMVGASALAASVGFANALLKTVPVDSCGWLAHHVGQTAAATLAATQVMKSTEGAAMAQVKTS